MEFKLQAQIDQQQWWSEQSANVILVKWMVSKCFTFERKTHTDQQQNMYVNDECSEKWKMICGVCMLLLCVFERECCCQSVGHGMRE